MGSFVFVYVLLTVPIVISLGRRIRDDFTRWRGIKFDLYKGDVSAIRGLLYLETFTEGIWGFSQWSVGKWYQIPAYRLYINGLEFGLRYRQWDALSEGERHPTGLYIAPNSRTILSIEVDMTAPTKR